MNKHLEMFMNYGQIKTIGLQATKNITYAMRISHFGRAVWLLVSYAKYKQIYENIYKLWVNIEQMFKQNYRW